MTDILNLLNPWWYNKKFDTGIQRDIYKKKLVKSLSHNRAVLLVGSRRVGKTTLFYQTIDLLLKKKVPPTHIFYILADHPQISTYKIMDLVENLRKQFTLNRKAKIYLFLDEVQYIKNWEQEVKALIDTENIKIFLSGSASAILLIKSPYLTGRIEKIEVKPLNFNEFLVFKKANIAHTESYKLEKYTNDYLKIGGYPEYVLNQDPSYFADLTNNILYKDIVNLYQLKNPDLLKDLFLLLSDRVGHQTTYSKLASVLNLKSDTVKEYIYYLKNTFLLDELPRFSTSRAARIYGPKKFYLNDNGMLFHLLGKLSYGSAFEQTLFSHLKSQFTNVFFQYENNKEIDFITKGENLQMFEAKYKFDNEFEKKIPMYLKSATENKITKIHFVTLSYEKKQKFDQIQVQFVPLWKLLTTTH